MSENENDMETIEKPKRRNASEKQLEHLRKIQPLATESKKRNKEIIQAVKKYEKSTQPKKEDVNVDDIRRDMNMIKEYLSREEERKILKKKQREAIDKQTAETYAMQADETYSSIFR